MHYAINVVVREMKIERYDKIIHFSFYTVVPLYP